MNAKIKNFWFFISQLAAAIFFVLSLCCLVRGIMFIHWAFTGTASGGAALGMIAGPILIFLGIGLFILSKELKYSSPKEPKKQNDTEKALPTKDSFPLWETVLQHNKEELQKALSKGADVNAPYPANGNTPLHIAAWNGYAEIGRLLLAQPGINKEAKNLAGKTPLDLAKEQNREEIIKLLEK